MKKILIFLILLFAATQGWAISGSGTSSNPYLISSKSDWNTFAGYVNNGTKSNAYAIQTADISGITTIVGTESYPFTGQYDGQGYTINNVSISGTEHVGLFGYVDGTSAIIKNIILTSGTVTASSRSVGSVVGTLGNGTVQYCANAAQVSCTNTSTTASMRCGGIVGYMPSSKSNTVTYCENYGAVNSLRYAGGVVGSAGGGTISYCHNYGTVTCSGTSQYCGGIVAYISGATLTNNHNGGNVNATSYTGDHTEGFIIRGDQNSIDASNTFLNDMQLIVKGTTYQHSNGAKPVTNWNNGATGVDTNPAPHIIGSYRFGSFGPSVYYLFNTSTHILTVKGTGAMSEDYDYDINPVHAFKNDIQEVVIESGVTSIGSFCFTSCSNLTEITLPEGITSIGEEAFNYCQNLQSISFPSSLTTISEFAFKNCTSLTTITIPSKVTTLGSGSYGAFWKCENVTDVICLADPTKLTWGGSSFKDFIYSPAKTTRCHVPSAKLSSFQSRFSSANVTFIPYTATGTCGTNASWTYDGTNNKIYVFGSGAMNNYASASSSPYYSYRSSATSIIVANSITSIGQNAFNGFSSVTSVTIPEGVTSIGTNAFANCSSLTTVTFPCTITQIGSGSTGSFASSNNITDIYIDVDPANLTWKYTSSDFKTSKGTQIHVPYRYYAAYTSKFSSINATFVQNTPTADDIFTISYTLNGGTVSSNKTSYNITTSTFTLNNPTRTGYTFAGWTGSNGSTPQTTVTITKGSYGNKSYTANWTPISYTISYTLNGGTVSPANPTSYTIESSAITLNNPTKTGYTFAGWTGTELSSASKSVTIAAGSTGNRSYTATWAANTYTVTLNKQSGTGGSNSVTATYGSAMPSATMPTRAHYTFGGYYTSSGGSGTQYYTSAGASARTWNLTSNTTLYAKWTACPTATVTAPTAKSLTYTGTAQALVNAGSASGGTLQYKLGSNGSWGTSIPTATAAGTYPVYYRVVADDSHTDNAGSSVSVTISKAALTCTADNKTVTYGDNPPTYTATYSGWKNSETSSVLSGTLSYSCSYAKNSNAGSYTITPSGVTASNYTISFQTGTLTVNKATPTVTAPTAKTLTYTGTAQALVNAGSTTGGTLQYKLGSGSWGTSIPTATTAGTYTVYYKVVGGTNYNDNAGSSVSVTISKAALTCKADNKSVTYGANPPTYTATYSGWKNSETSSVLSGTLSYSCTYAKNSNAGSYTITPSGVTASNYTISVQTGTLTVNKATPTVTAPTAKTLTYTGSAQSLVNAGSTTGGTLQYKLGSNGSWGTSIPTATTAGTYTVYYKVVGGTNYNDNAGSSVSVTISKAALTCKADNKSVTYGASAPTYTATYSGWKNSETTAVLSGTLSFACTYAKGSNAGSYTITPSGVTASNYTITFQTGTLTVNKATPTVTAPTAKTLTYTGSAQSLVNAGSTTGGEMQYSLTSGSGFSTTIPTRTNAGTYVVYYKIVGGTNYIDVPATYVSVTINKAASSVTATPTAKSLVYTGSSQTLVNAGTASGGTMNYSLDNSSWSTSLPTATTAGEYTVYYKVVGDGNHSNTSASSIKAYIDYTISYDLDGGSVASANPTRYNVTTASFTLNNPTRTGYTFAGWTGSNGDTPETTVTISNGSTGNKSYTATWTENIATLNQATDNSTFISDHNGDVYDITLTRTLNAGGWNTFCAPFDISSGQITSVFGSGTKVRELNSSSYDEVTKALTLNFTSATNIEAGKPYLVYLGSATAVSNPTFNDVTIVDETTTTTTTYANFVPVMNPTSVTTNDKTVLFVTGGNQLTYPSSTGNINGFRAYFQLPSTVAAAAACRMHFEDDNATDITIVLSEEFTAGDNLWYLPDGRLIGSQPSRPGLYITKGKKVFIK